MATGIGSIGKVARVSGGVGVDVPVQLLVLNKAVPSNPDGPGRLTRLTVGTNLKTLVVVAVAGTEETGTASTFGVAWTSVVDGSGSVPDVDVISELIWAVF